MIPCSVVNPFGIATTILGTKYFELMPDDFRSTKNIDCGGSSRPTQNRRVIYFAQIYGYA